MSNEVSGSEENSTSLVEEVKIELSDIDNSDLTEHAARFDALHGKLQEALNSIDGL
ncbi:unannotated protein [freshwater metagenome]|jgi:hypothetical protein|uniref:Unannotated protein n=1 Tax=freshwater metagenome TaxID=449393 RepID=A0A6J6CW42_9ZZZZ|nr:hypothetical protein [Actinomycetota bacterium]